MEEHVCYICVLDKILLMDRYNHTLPSYTSTDRKAHSF